MKNSSSTMKEAVTPCSIIDTKQLRRGSSLVAGSISGRTTSLALSKPTRTDTRPIHDKRYQAAMTRSINSYLHSHGFSSSLSPKKLPSGKDVKDIINFMVHQLDPAWELEKLEDDVPILFRQYGYPFQINRSALQAAGSPHSWPALLAALSWLVQLLNYKEIVEEEEGKRNTDGVADFLEESYGYFLRGDDNAAETLERQYTAHLEEERLFISQRTTAAENRVHELETRIKGLKTGALVIEELNQKKAVIAEDVNKFHLIIDNLSSKKDALEKRLVEQRQELEENIVQIEHCTKENEELKQQVDSQDVNIRDYQKMKREYQIIEADVRTTEDSRNQWEEKVWELEVSASKKLKELERAIDRYNQDIVRLKLGSQFEYKLNSRGMTATDILGVDFKATIRPQIISSTEDYELNYRKMWEESVAVQQKLHDKWSELERKIKVNVSLSAQIKKIEACYNAVKNSMERFVTSKAMECEKLLTDVENNENVMKEKEAEADNFLKKATSELEEITRHYDEEIQARYNELFQLIDIVAKHKESVVMKISSVKTAVTETDQEVKRIYNWKNNHRSQ